MTNDELNLKFKGLLGDFYQNFDIEYVGNYLKELKCPFYHHEFMRRATLMAMEKDNDCIEGLLKLINVLNVHYNLTEQ